ncbi:metallophosphoesterase [Niallia sp. XMNu-256]|uniref:metallophosphoesterase n=1 Tax=Niallia sp. XMNu-256 TaxID=3082444 RepID=UPI0030CC9C4E
MTFSTIVFAALLISVYLLLCFYIGYNGWVWLQSTRFRGKGKKFYILFIAFLAISTFLGQMAPSTLLTWLGGYWMAVVGYSLILLPLANMIVFLLKKRGIFWGGMSVLSCFVFIFIIGSYNAWNPVVQNVEISIAQPNEQTNKVKIMMASDLHLGEIVGKSHLEKLIDISAKENPDMIVIAGDVIDDDIEPFQEEKMRDVLEKLQARLGVYAVSGNHDVYGKDLIELEKELEQVGIRFLRDEAVLINDLLYIVGRRDLAEGERKAYDTLLTGLDRSKPIVTVDHQPTEMDEAEQAGVDLLLSGHTHKGQLAPANLITNMIFENDGGYMKKETLHTLVSSGFGTWGPPLRIGSRSEVVVIHFYF